MDPLIDRAALGVTELLSNVHRHARPDKSCTVELELLSDRLTVSVRDHDPRLPVVADEAEAAHATPLATCGRGLAMVAAVSESWGARPDGDDGKVVWFTLPASAAAHGQRAPLRTTEQQPVPRITEMQPAPAPVAASAPAPTVTHTSAMTPVRTSPPVSAPAPAPALAPVAASASAPAPARSAVPG